MEPFRLRNETRRRPAVKPAPRQRQLQLLSGLDCLAGQQDLIDVDGPAGGDEEPDAVKAKPIISGTREWAVENVNIILGCPHKCRYCYARANALRFGKIKRSEEWGDTYHRLRADQARRPRRLVDGQVMFPTTHDITPEHLGPCLETIERILAPGNRLLIVSKPHLECIEAICHRFSGERILFRFSIGSADNSILSYWEPGAPSFDERLTSLVLAHTLDFRTSVSAEPLLDADNVGRLVEQVRPYVTDSIWIGKMNRIRNRVVPGTSLAEIERIEAGQTDEAVRGVYRLLADDPLIRWKESYKQVLGLDLATVAGQDR